MAQNLPDLYQAPTQTPQSTDIRELKLRAKARKKLEYLKLRDRYAADPWAFLSEQVMTEDPHDKNCSVKPYPAHLDYLHSMVDAWMGSKRFLVPKSRRMHVSWTFIALHVWLMLFHKHEYIYFAARKEGRDESEGSLELVKRAKFIINNLRTFKPPQTDQRRGRVVCTETGSEINAVGEGKDQFRQMAATAIFADEFAFWEKARETYSAARPTIEASGRFTGVSSAYPGFFKELVFDEVGFTGTGADKMPITCDIPGVRRWKNSNGFEIFRVHYTADPRKRTTAWRESERSGIAANEWNREYEIDFASFMGKPVFEHDYDDSTMCKPFKLDPKAPVLRSWDFGYHHPAVVWGQFVDGSQLRILNSHMGSDIDFRVFARYIIYLSNLYFPNRTFIDCCDIAGQYLKPTDDPEIIILQNEFGIIPRRRKFSVAETIGTLRDLMHRTWKGEPRFLINDTPENDLLREAFKGGYHYAEQRPNRSIPEEPAQDGYYENIIDPVRYMAQHFGGVNAQNYKDLVNMSTRDALEMEYPKW